MKKKSPPQPQFPYVWNGDEPSSLLCEELSMSNDLSLFFSPLLDETQGCSITKLYSVLPYCLLRFWPEIQVYRKAST